MNGKELRKQRTETYFIDALCDIIREQGMEAATIRNVAERAGYNSATLYTYFDNFSHLMLRAHMRFEEEVLSVIQADDRIRNADRLYDAWGPCYVRMAAYYLDHPNIFQCVFVSGYEGAVPEELRQMHAGQSEFAQYVGENLKRISREEKIPLDTVLRINDTCLALTVGTVLLQVSNRYHQSCEEVLACFEKQIETILKSNTGIVVTESRKGEGRI